MMNGPPQVGIAYTSLHHGANDTDVFDWAVTFDRVLVLYQLFVCLVFKILGKVTVLIL